MYPKLLVILLKHFVLSLNRSSVFTLFSKTVKCQAIDTINIEDAPDLYLAWTDCVHCYLCLVNAIKSCDSIWFYRVIRQHFLLVLQRNTLWQQLGNPLYPHKLFSHYSNYDNNRGFINFTFKLSTALVSCYADISKLIISHCIAICHNPSLSGHWKVQICCHGLCSLHLSPEPKQIIV